MAKKFKDLKPGDRLYSHPTDVDVREHGDVRITTYIVEKTEYWNNSELFAMYIRDAKTGVTSAYSVDISEENLSHKHYMYTSHAECKSAYRKECQELMQKYEKERNASQKEIDYIRKVIYSNC